MGLAGHDLIAPTKTGSGKTTAFALPLLARLDVRRFAIQGLVPCPTRDLTEQASVRSRTTCCAGSPGTGERAIANDVLRGLGEGKVKGKAVKVRRL